MKRIFLVAATSTALLSSLALADNFDNTFYVKGSVGTNVMTRAEDNVTGMKMKPKASTAISLGAGYYFMDNVRSDVTLDIYLDPEIKRSGKVVYLRRLIDASVKHKATINAVMLNNYIDFYDFGVAKVFAGAGLGVAQVKEKITYTGDVNRNGIGTVSFSVKSKNNFSYQLTFGANAPVASGVNAELSYSWRDYGKTRSNTTKVPYRQAARTHYRGHNFLGGIRFDL